MDKYVCTLCGYVYDPELGCEEMDVPQVQSGKMYPMTSDALFAELIKMHLKRSSENLITFLLTDKLAEEGIALPISTNT